MSAATVVPLSRGRYTIDLEEQLLRLAPERPERLVIRCSEPRPHGPPPWQRRLGRALVLETPGAGLQGVGVREAIRHAVSELGAPELLVVAHSRCAHLARPTAPEWTPDPESGDGRFFDLMRRRVVRAQLQLAAARDRVRESLRMLAADPELRRVPSAGWVHLVESGALLAYDPRRDAFEALP